MTTSIALTPELALLSVLLTVGIASPVDTAISRLRKLAAIPKKGLSAVLGRAVILPIVTLFASLAGLVVSALNVPITTLDALARGIGSLVSVTFGVPTNLLQTGGRISAQNLAIFGFAAVLVAMALILGIFWMISAYRDEEETGNVFPGLPFDIPGFSQEEGGD